MKRTIRRTAWLLTIADSVFTFASKSARAQTDGERADAVRVTESDDVDFVIEESDPRMDWYYAQMPHNENPDAEIVEFRGVAGEGRAAPRTIHFRLEEEVHGRAVLRIALNGTGSRPLLDLSVNGNPVKRVTFGSDDRAFDRRQTSTGLQPAS